MKTKEEIQAEIDRVKSIKSEAFSNSDWQYGNELNSWILALEWVIEESDKL